MEATTIWAAVFAWPPAIGFALGWFAGSVVMWRYMLRVCDQEHAKVLKLEVDKVILRAEISKLEAELALRSNFNNQMAAEIVDHRISAGARVKATKGEPAPKCEHCDKRMEWDDKWTKWVCLCKLRARNAQTPG